MSSITVRGELGFATASIAKKAHKELTKADCPFGTLSGSQLHFEGTHEGSARAWGPWVMAAQLAAVHATSGSVRLRSDDIAIPRDLVPGGWLRRVIDDLPEPAVCRLGSLRFRHAGGITAVATQPERGWLASSSKGATHFHHEAYKHDAKGFHWGTADLVVWDVDTGEVVAEFLGRAEAVVDMAFSGARLLVGAQCSKRYPQAAARSTPLCAFVFDLDRGTTSFWPGSADRGGLCWCGPDRFAITGRHSVSICTPEAEELFELFGHHKELVDVAWCDDTQRLFSLDQGGEVVAWDVQTGRMLGRVQLAEKRRSSLHCWKVDGRNLIAANGFKPILVDPTDLGVVEGVTLPHSINAVFHQGEEQVNVHGDAWDIAGQTFDRLGPLGNPAIDPSRELLAQASTHYRKVVLRNVRTGAWRTHEPMSDIKCVHMSGDMVGAFEWMRSHWVHALPDASPRMHRPFRFSHDGAALPSPCGQRVACSIKEKLEVVTLESGDATVLHEGRAHPLGWTPDGEHLFVARDTQLVRFSLADASTRELAFEGDYSPDEGDWARMLDEHRLVVLWRGVRVWDLRTDELVLERVDGEQAFFDDDALTIWSRGRKALLETFDLDTLQPRTTHELPRGLRAGGLLSHTLGVETRFGTARLVDLPSQEVRLVLGGHLSGGRPACALSTDNRWFATFGGEGTVLVYEREELLARASA